MKRALEETQEIVEYNGIMKYDLLMGKNNHTIAVILQMLEKD